LKGNGNAVRRNKDACRDEKPCKDEKGKDKEAASVTYSTIQNGGSTGVGSGVPLIEGCQPTKGAKGVGGSWNWQLKEPLTGIQKT